MVGVDRSKRKLNTKEKQERRLIWKAIQVKRKFFLLNNKWIYDEKCTGIEVRSEFGLFQLKSHKRNVYCTISIYLNRCLNGFNLHVCRLVETIVKWTNSCIFNSLTENVNLQCVQCVLNDPKSKIYSNCSKLNTLAWYVISSFFIFKVFQFFFLLLTHKSISQF